MDFALSKITENEDAKKMFKEVYNMTMTCLSVSKKELTPAFHRISKLMEPKKLRPTLSSRSLTSNITGKSVTESINKRQKLRRRGKKGRRRKTSFRFSRW